MCLRTKGFCVDSRFLSPVHVNCDCIDMSHEDLTWYPVLTRAEVPWWCSG